MNEEQILQILRQLVRLGVPVSQLAGLGSAAPGLGAAGSGLGLIGSIQGGNIPGAIGNAASLGSNVAGMAGATGLASGLGSVGAPIGLGLAASQGNVPGIISAVPGTVAAGASAAAAMGLLAPALAGTIASGAGLAAIPLLFLLPAIFGKDADVFGGLIDMIHPQKDPLKESKTAGEDFSTALQTMARGAGTLGQSGNLMDLLGTAQAGIDTRKNIGHNFDVVKHGTRYMDGLGPTAEIQEIEKILPKLSGANWKSWSQLMDRAAREGGNPHEMTWDDYQKGSIWDGTSTDASVNGIQPWQRPYEGQRGMTTREANDMSQAIFGAAMERGQDLQGALPGGRGQGGYLAPEQLIEYGFTPGNYENAINAYLDRINAGTLPAWKEPDINVLPRNDAHVFTPPEVGGGDGGGGGGL